MIQIIYSVNGQVYDHIRCELEVTAKRIIKALEERGAIIQEIKNDKSQRDEEVDRKSRGVS